MAKELHAEILPLTKADDRPVSTYEKVLSHARGRLSAYSSEDMQAVYSRWKAETDTAVQMQSDTTGRFQRRAAALLENSQDLGAVAVGRGSQALVDPAAPLAQVVGDVHSPGDAEDVGFSLGSAPLPALPESVKQLRKSRLAAFPSLQSVLPRQLLRRKQAVRIAVKKSAPSDPRAQMAMLRASLSPEQWQTLRAMGKD